MLRSQPEVRGFTLLLTARRRPSQHDRNQRLWYRAARNHQGGIVSYDAQVYQLVEHFLSRVPEKNTERNRQLLAQHIQDEIEDWILLMLLPDAQQACGL